MFRKLIYLVSFVLVLGLVGDVQAADVAWTGGPDHLWSTPANWGLGTLPTPADTAEINMLPGPTIVNEGAVAGNVWLGGIGALTVDGGTLTISGESTVDAAGGILLGRRADQSGTLNMKSGTITVDGELTVGHKGPGTLNMTGGTITVVGGTFTTADYLTSTGHVDLDGGIITANDFLMREQPGAVGTMDVGGGTLIINGDKLSLIQGYIDNGWINAYDGNGTLQMDYEVTNEGATTLTALHKFNPIPADGGTVGPGAVELSWTLPDPCVPGQPVSVDVYFTDDLLTLELFTDPAAIQVVSKQNVTSVVVQTQPKTRYYWAIDTYVDSAAAFPVVGPIFSFFADNLPPKVDAGADVATWLADGVRTKNLDATVTDDEATTVQWTVVSEPNVGTSVIETTTAEDTNITLTALGEYVLQLEAFDGKYTGSDTVTINVYNDGCEAAQSLPDYEPVPGDLNGDCIVDDLDLAILQENWLKDDSLTEEWVLLVD